MSSLNSRDRISSTISSRPGPPKSGYIPTLDGWRAVAIIAVLINHDKTWLPASWVHNFGREGVDLFFALSGILICTRLLDEEQTTGRISLRNFYTRRIFRIQPAALAYLACISLLMLSGVITRAFSGVFFAATFLRNYLPLHARLADWFTAHFWSLSVEEHFYLMFPGLLIILKKYRVSMLMSLAVVLAFWQMMLNRHPSLQFGWSPFAHTDVAITGILLAASSALLLIRPPVRAWCQAWLHPYAALAVAAIVWFGLTQKFQGTDTLFSFAVLCTYPLIIVSTALHPQNLIGKALEFAPLRFIGRISYSIYLWQMLFFCTVYAMPAPHSAILFHIQMSWMRYPATLVASVISYYAVEKPMIKLGHRLTKSTMPKRGVTSGLPATGHEQIDKPLITGGWPTHNPN
jgi:peptidoglycan/LPS O-acetylase OafA/YrhL